MQFWMMKTPTNPKTHKRAMRLLYHPVFEQHDTGAHPEGSQRMEAFRDFPVSDIPSGESYLPLVHTPYYIEQVKDACRRGVPLDGDTRTSPGSYEAAIRGVGATLQAAEQGDFALCRPPGHHAYASRGSGFCLFNNIAIATRKLVNEGKRVAIFDFDGHMGDGTASIFNHEKEVLYWSIHQYPAFPGYGRVNEIGAGKGEGFTINVPLPPGSGDDIFMNAVDTFFPVLQQFQPDVLAISAGFDAHRFDPLLDLNVTLGSFHKIGRMIRDSFDNYFATLEGGYNVEVLVQGVFNFTAGICGLDAPYQEAPTESSLKTWAEYEIRLHSLLGHLKSFWEF
jgi:acetoin utilization deacetylase AcuC-like enzyme